MARARTGAQCRAMPFALRLLRQRLGAMLLVCCSAGGACAAEISDITRREVSLILARIAQSGCEFYRSGSWYSATEARDHLERKYRYLAARQMIATAEDFVALAGTRSSMTDEAYAIRCRGAAPQASAIWLVAELRSLRATEKAAPPR